MYKICDTMIKICKGSDDVAQHWGVNESKKKKACIPRHRISFFNLSKKQYIYFFMPFLDCIKSIRPKKERGDCHEH